MQNNNDKTTALSPTYERFPEPILTTRNGFDFHVYYRPASDVQTKHAKELHASVQKEFPELFVYRLWDKPVGPHPTAMFEIQTTTPHQTGALFSWLVVHRGPLDVLIHPHTGDPYRDHVELATWMGHEWELRLDLLREFVERSKGNVK